MATVSEAILLAFDLQCAGRIAEAETLYDRVLAVDPKNPDALHLSGLLLGQSGRLDAGLARLSQAVLLRPESAEFHANHGKLLLAAGRTEAAVDAFRKAVAHGAKALSGQLAELLRDQGRHHLNAASPANAAAAFREALALQPDDVGALSGLGDACYDQGAWAAAAAAYRAALLAVPSSHRLHYNAGSARLKAGSMAEAAMLFGRAAVIEPDHLDTREHLVATLYHAGRFGEATRVANDLLAWKKREAMRAPPGLKLLRASASAGGSKRVIAFSLWGQSSIYTRGAIENARLTAEFYPGWTCRIYHDDSVPEAVLQELAGLSAELIAMEAGSGPSQGLYWRFLASDDPAVGLFLCRDADSRLNSRERAAVDEWVASGLPFHVMRDHIMHTDLILAGMWGGRAGMLPPLAPLVRGVASLDGGRLQDQRFLGRFVWPLIEGRCLVHDSAHAPHGCPFPEVPIDARFAFTHVGACIKDT